MKQKYKGKKGIPPPKEGFEYVTCANYFWEFLAWFCFSIVSLHWSVFLFTCCGFYQMREWAIKKHKEIKKAFGDKYPKERKAFIPFFI
jgi:very-long-chain enoyl-CoA reductase